MWWRMLLTTALYTLKDVVKNPESKAQLRGICLEMYRLIQAAYAGDPDFQG